MSDPKFRAWDEGNKVMHYDFQFIKSGDTGSDWIIFTSDKQPLNSKPHPFENPYFGKQFKIMQFTGLLDKSGKEIYEGDIVQDSAEKCAVKWFNEAGAWGMLDSDETMVWLGDYNTSCEIIGNIYEKPDRRN